MTYLYRYQLHILTTLMIFGMTWANTYIQSSRPLDQASFLPAVHSRHQGKHANELVRKQTSVILNPHLQVDVRPFILKTLEASLPEQHKHRAYEIARAVILEANHNKLDPMFVLAVIKTESKFNPDVKGDHGEIGLMQVLPKTARWLAPQAGLPVDCDLTDPAVNIRIGALYFAQLRKSFSGKSSRYVAAYNMGAKNVRRLLASKTEPYIYPGLVIGNYKEFYKTLEKQYRVISRDIAALD